jgi:hypothetical protein
MVESNQGENGRIRSNRMTNEQLQRAIELEIKSLFGDHVKEIEKELKDWSIRLLDLKISMISGENLASKKKTEQYAWAAVMCLLARHAEKVERNSWKFLERSLRLVRNIILGG